MQFRSSVRSLVVFNSATKTLSNTTRNCRVNYVCKLFFSSIPTHAGSAMPTLSSVSRTYLCVSLIIFELYVTYFTQWTWTLSCQQPHTVICLCSIVCLLTTPLLLWCLQSKVGATELGGIPAADSSVQRCADQLASVSLQQPQQLQPEEKAYLTLQTARPKRR